MDTIRTLRDFGVTARALPGTSMNNAVEGAAKRLITNTPSIAWAATNEGVEGSNPAGRARYLF